MKIYRTTDRIEVKIDTVSIFVSPLSYKSKMEMQDLMLKASSGDMSSAMQAVIMALKVSIKDIKGLSLPDGSDYTLSFIGDELTQDCIDDLLNLSISNKISSVCTSLLAGIPNEIVDSNGAPVPGIKIVNQEPRGKK